jgi:hypothetical protein
MVALVTREIGCVPADSMTWTKMFSLWRLVAIKRASQPQCRKRQRFNRVPKGRNLTSLTSNGITIPVWRYFPFPGEVFGVERSALRTLTFFPFTTRVYAFTLIHLRPPFVSAMSSTPARFSPRDFLATIRRVQAIWLCV